MYGLRAVREVTADRSMLGDNARLIRESGQISESATLKIQIGMFGAMAISQHLAAALMIRGGFFGTHLKNSSSVGYREDHETNGVPDTGFSPER